MNKQFISLQDHKAAVCASPQASSASFIDDQHFIASLFNLNVQDIQELHTSKDTKSGDTFIYIKLHPSFPSCPYCGDLSPRIKDYYPRRINHSVLSNTHTTLIYKDRRYLCPHCNKTFYTKSPFTENGFKHSLLTTQHILEDLKDPNKTMASIAKRYDLSPTTIAHVFDAHVHIGRRKLPSFLSIDEVYAFKSKQSKYVCVLLDYKNKVPVDILPSRKYDDLARFFSSIPKEELESVKVFSTDMWETYRKIATNYLPNASVICDHFHVIQECNKRLDHIRINIQKSFSTKDDAYYLLKKFNWVLFKNDMHLLDPNRHKRYNKRMKRYLNYHDIKCLLQDSHPELEVAINLKDALCMFYDTIKIIEPDQDPEYKEIVPSVRYKPDGKPTKRSIKLHDEAKKRNEKRILTEQEALCELEELIGRFRNCPLVEFSNFASTLHKWKHEIINSLKVYSELDNRAVSNALIENRNKIIKNVKHTSNGYANWNRFRNRLMYTLTPDATYSLNADPEVIERKRLRNQQYYQNWKLNNEKS